MPERPHRGPSVYVNAGVERAFRAPGFPQCAWAFEQAIDELAVKLEMDPVTLRLKSIPAVSQPGNDMPYTSNGLPQCLSEGARPSAGRRPRRRAGDGPVVNGVGVAACSGAGRATPFRR